MHPSPKTFFAPAVTSSDPNVQVFNGDTLSLEGRIVKAGSDEPTTLDTTVFDETAGPISSTCPTRVGETRVIFSGGLDRVLVGGSNHYVSQAATTQLDFLTG